MNTAAREPAPTAGAAEPQGPTGGPDPGDGSRGEGGPARRFWSARRVPAAVLALLLLGATGLLLYDVAAVRADRPAAAWRRGLADELATRELQDPWVLAGAVLAVLLGIWLLVLALTPGLRGLLPMRRDRRGGAAVRPALDRRAAALVLRDRALHVSGVRAVRVTVGRRRVRAAAQSRFRDLNEVRADLDVVLGRAVDELGLDRRPTLSVHVRRPPRG